MKIDMRVDDLDAYLNRAERLGGKRLVPDKVRCPDPVRCPGPAGAGPGRAALGSSERCSADANSASARAVLMLR